MRITFVCVRNADRSQMAAAFAEPEQRRRDLDDRVELVTGGTEPADAVHPEAVDAMAERGFDLSGRSPGEITPDTLPSCDYVVTMGCSAGDVCPATCGGESRDWDLNDPHGKVPETVRAIRDEIERRVADLFDELVGEEGGER